MRAAEFFNQWQPHLSVGLEFFRFEGSDLIAEVAGYHSQSPHDGPIGRLPSHQTVSSQTRTFLGRGQQPCRRPLRVDFVAKVENRTTQKISRKLIFGLL